MLLTFLRYIKLILNFEMDIPNGHSKWAQDGHKGKNIYGLGPNVIKKIALKEIDRK